MKIIDLSCSSKICVFQEALIIDTDDDEYYEIFSSSLFDGKLRKKPLNWLQENDKQKKIKKESEDEG